jgi:hypothetical protein
MRLRHQGAVVVETVALLTGYCPTCDGGDVIEELARDLPPDCILGWREDVVCGYCGDCLFVTQLGLALDGYVESL